MGTKKATDGSGPALASLLHEWREMPATDSKLASNVRRQIRATPKDARRRDLSWFGRALTWPRLAVACVAAGVALGIGVAEVRDRLRLRDAKMPAQYLRWIQPAGDMMAGGPR